MGTQVNQNSSLPELGPALGRLVHPAAEGGIEGLLAPVRLALVTRLLGAAGESREALDRGDELAGREALAPSVWAQLWDTAAEEAATLLTRQLDERITAGAVASRMPARRAERHRVTPAEHRAIHARLGAGAGAMLRTAADLEQASGAAWPAQVLATARRMESAWAALASAAGREMAEWEADILLVASWRRARWPLWVFTVLVFAVALWFGLVLGGYLPVPSPLYPIADFWWSRS